MYEVGLVVEYCVVVLYVSDVVVFVVFDVKGVVEFCVVV